MAFSASVSASQAKGTGTTVNKNVISQEAFNKIIYDVMSSDQGLASLASGENASGGFGSSTKTLQAQDFSSKLIGELAKLRSESVQQEDTKKTEIAAGAKGGSVICTWMADNGYLDRATYEAGEAHFQSLNHSTVLGYQSWAIGLTATLHTRPKLVRVLSYLVSQRYKHILGKPNLVGAITVYIGQPSCYLIGKLIQGINHARRNNELAGSHQA